ncbi:MAG: hypothetical protein IJA63_05035 [Akkermansia sp.]|nr:hypothetical protein [Akkermansia sp.]
MNFTSDREELTKPNGMTLTQNYETQRDLLISMAYHRGSTLVQSDAEVRQPFISRAGIIFIPTTYYHNS